jgi:hypothetical protein
VKRVGRREERRKEERERKRARAGIGRSGD